MTSMNGSNTFTCLKLIHSNLACLCSSNDFKHEVMDQNRVPYAVKFSRDVANLFAVSDENGFVKLFETVPRFRPLKEFKLQRSCIYDLQWLNRTQLVCGGGDKNVSLFDVHTGLTVSLMKGHSESVKSISIVPDNQFVLASGSRDGSILIFDLRCNRQQAQLAAQQMTDENDDYSLIKPVNSLPKAHFDLTQSGSTSSPRCARASKHAQSVASANSNNNSFALRRATPVSSIAFQSEFQIVSAGSADGLVKVWDTRKIYSPPSNAAHSKLFEPAPPLFSFYAPIVGCETSNNTLPIGKISSKASFSSVAFNRSHTKLYANCMNNNIYEFNFTTMKQKHTRTLNNPVLDTEDILVDEQHQIRLNRAHHSNSSNFIRSCLSPCDNFLLTGSSDSNAYIYSTNVNADLAHFRSQMPVIVLRGHNNEVTAVDWSPLDLDQLVTCSDDNTIRLWTVKRNLSDDRKSDECMFLSADICYDKYEQYVEKRESEEGEEVERVEIVAEHQPDPSRVTRNDRQCFISSVSCSNNPRLNNHRPHYVSLLDDKIFTGYEYSKRFRRCQPIRLEEDDYNSASDSTHGGALANLPINIREKRKAEAEADARVVVASKLLNWPIGFLASKNDQLTKTTTSVEPKSLKIVSKRSKKTLIDEEEEQQNSENFMIGSGSLLAKSPKAKRRNIEKISKSTIKKPSKAKRTFLNSTNLSMSATKSLANRSTINNLFMNLNDLKKPLDLIENSMEENSEPVGNSSEPKSKKRLIMQPSSVINSSSSSSQSQHQQQKVNNRSILDYFGSK